MHWLSFLACLGWVLQDVYATPTPHQLSEKRDEESGSVLQLRRTGVKAHSSKELLVDRAASATTPLNAVESGGGYGVDVTLGSGSYTLVFDSGSSDLWVAGSDVECVNQKGKKVATSKCAFGTLFPGTFQGGQIANENFNISYGDGEFVVGILGKEDVTLAGITVDDQEIAVGDEAFWIGDGVVSGIIGFAFPSLTAAYPGDNPAVDNPATNNIHYTNWMFNAIKQGKVNPLFSVAIERGSTGGGGQVALGGLPTISFTHDFTSTPLKIKEFSPRHPQGATEYTYYTIKPDGFVLDGQFKATGLDTIIDTGTTLMYLPDDLAIAINDAFDPPSTFISSEGLFENDCNATPPSFSVRIGGTNYQISGSELLIPKPLGYDPSTGGCVTGIQPVSQPPYILGDTFLKNVVAVFDIGNKEMRFAPHETY